MLELTRDTDFFVVKIFFVAATICYGLVSVYPMIFACWYIHKGHLHRLLQNLLSTNYIDPQYLNEVLFRCIQLKATRCKWCIYTLLTIQFIGWMVQSEVTEPHTAYWIMASLLWPFCWAMFKFLPFVAGLSVFMIVLEVLRIEKELYIQQIASAGKSCQSGENKLYFVFHEVDISNVTEFDSREEMEIHLNDSYLNLVGLCHIHGKLWSGYVVLLCAALLISLLCGASLLYFCKSPSYLSVVMVPSFYVVLAPILLYQIADLNSTSSDALSLLSAVRLGECSTQMQMIKMMEYNRVEMNCAGITIDYDKVNAVAVTAGSLLVTAFLHFTFPNVFDDG